jgi:hypothetical protein
MPGNLDDYLKRIGVPEATPETAPPAEPKDRFGESLMPPPAFGGRRYNELGLLEKGEEIAGKGYAQLAHGTGKLASHFVPGWLSRFVAESAPGHAITEEAERPYQSEAEKWGARATELGGLVAGGAPGAGAKVGAKLGEKALEKLWPVGKVWIPGTGGRFGRFYPQYSRPREIARKVARGVGTGVESGAKGAVAGAIGDPDDPATGAMYGGLGGLAGPITGGAMRSQVGQFVGGQIPGAALTGLAGAGVYGATHALGLPWEVGAAAQAGVIGPAIHWYSSPIGKRLRRFGSYVMDEFGNIIGKYAAPATGGTAAGIEKNLNPPYDTEGGPR